MSVSRGSPAFVPVRVQRRIDASTGSLSRFHPGFGVSCVTLVGEVAYLRRKVASQIQGREMVFGLRRVQQVHEPPFLTFSSLVLPRERLRLLWGPGCAGVCKVALFSSDDLPS